jgi:hypothetical protein
MCLSIFALSYLGNGKSYSPNSDNELTYVTVVLCKFLETLSFVVGMEARTCVSGLRLVVRTCNHSDTRIL